MFKPIYTKLVMIRPIEIKQLFKQPKLIIISLFILISCAPSHKGSSTMGKIDKTSFISPKILFLKYQFIKNDENQIEAKLINTTKVDGQIKTNRRPIRWKNGDIRCVQVNYQGDTLSLTYIKNPFVKTFEFIGETMELEKKTVELDSTKVSIRVQLKPNTHRILIEQKQNQLNKTLISSYL